MTPHHTRHDDQAEQALSQRSLRLPANDARANAATGRRRLFIAIMLPPAVQERLSGALWLLESFQALLRPAPLHHLHLTLRFLGDLSFTQQQRVREVCAAAVAGLAPFHLTIGGFGAFPERGHPSVIWLRVQQGREMVVLLHERLQCALAREHAPPADFPFAPHITLADVRPEVPSTECTSLGDAIGRLPETDHAACIVTEISLVHSAPTPQGRQYTVLEAWRLEPPTDGSPEPQVQPL